MVLVLIDASKKKKTDLGIHYISFLLLSFLFFCVLSLLNNYFNRLFIGPSLGGALAEHFGFAWAVTVCKCDLPNY